MSIDVDPVFARKRTRHRLVVRWLAGASAVGSLGTLIALFGVGPSVFPARTALFIPVVTVTLCSTVFCGALLVLQRQRSALSRVCLAPLGGPPAEEWALGAEKTQKRVQMVGGVVVGLFVLACVGLLLLEPIALQAWSRTLVPWLVGLWLLAVVVGGVLITGMMVRYMLASANDSGIRWALRWLVGIDRIGLRCVAYQALAAPGAATMVIEQWHGDRARSVELLAAYFSVVARRDLTAARKGFSAVHTAAPEHPLAAMGLTDTALALGQPVPLAAAHACRRSAVSLFWGYLGPYARANEARCFALVGDADAALERVDALVRSVEDAPSRRRAGVLHRLSCALESLDPERAESLRATAAELDPDGEIGKRAAQNLAPLPYWV